MIEIDHVFVACSKNAPEASVLIDHGFREGSSNTHPGQGTANRRFFFENFMLELIWVDNEQEAQSALTQPTRLWERCTQRHQNTSPFGLVFRPVDPDRVKTPFPSWKYHPHYLPPELAIEIATGTDIAEPGIFYLPFARRQINGGKEPVKHTLSLRRLKRIEFGLPTVDNLTKEFRKALDAGGVACFHSDAQLVQCVFEGEAAIRVDLRPHLPVILMTETADLD